MVSVILLFDLLREVEPEFFVNLFLTLKFYCTPNYYFGDLLVFVPDFIYNLGRIFGLLVTQLLIFDESGPKEQASTTFEMSLFSTW